MDKIVEAIHENVKVVIYTHTRGYNKTSRAKIFTIVNPCKVTTYYRDNWGYLEFIDPLTDKPAKIKRKKFTGYLIIDGTEEPERIFPGFEGFVDRKKRKARTGNPPLGRMPEFLGHGQELILNPIHVPHPVQFIAPNLDLRQIVLDNALKDMIVAEDTRMFNLIAKNENRE